MRKKNIILISVLTIILSSCADVSNIQDCLSEVEHTYGFWGGTWHGVITGPSFIASLFWDDVSIYAINNNGAWYDFGFVGGLSFFIKTISQILKLTHRN